MTVSVSVAIPNGSGQVVAVADSGDVRLRLRRDAGPDPLAIGYFHFRATGVRGKACTFRILDVGIDARARLAGREGYEDEWTNTGPHVSYDRKYWFRIPARLEGDDYVFRHTPEHDVCYYAKWAPYPEERELDLVAR